MEIINRKYYEDKIDAWIGKGQILVLTGQRRAGKSYVLKNFTSRHQDAISNIIYINKEHQSFDHIKTYENLNQYIKENFDTGKHNYILIDEIQEILGWEKSVRSWRLEDNTDIIITGSNSQMLSSELSTYIGGRYQEIRIHSLTYPEFLVFHKLEDDDESLWKYINYGGLPGLVHVGLQDEELIWDYIRGVRDTIMLKDVVERHSIRNITFMNNLLRFFADSVGKMTSSNSISRYMKGLGLDISVKSIVSYLGYFAETYLLSVVNRYDIHGKKLLEFNDKLYFGDVGLRNLIAGGERSGDIEKVIENIVYMHLQYLGYSVSVGQLRVGEVDFICTKPNERKYVQVAYIIADEATEEREFGRLRDIADNYPKYVISMTPLIKRSDNNGITHIGLREFLVKGF